MQARSSTRQRRDTGDGPTQARARSALTRDPDILAFVGKFLTGVEAKATHTTIQDPLAALDDPLPRGEAYSAIALGEAQAIDVRRALLCECVAAEAAARLTRRSRQSLERLRRAGRVLALRVGNQWRYPRWQFDLDATGGVIPGL